MRRNLGLLGFLFLAIYMQPVLAQTDSLAQIINDLSEDETYLVDFLQELKEHPVNIKTASYNQLVSIPLITHNRRETNLTLNCNKYKVRGF